MTLTPARRDKDGNLQCCKKCFLLNKDDAGLQWCSLHSDVFFARDVVTPNIYMCKNFTKKEDKLG